jgi:hypothetical protein
MQKLKQLLKRQLTQQKKPKHKFETNSLYKAPILLSELFFIVLSERGFGWIKGMFWIKILLINQSTQILVQTKSKM